MPVTIKITIGMTEKILSLLEYICEDFGRFKAWQEDTLWQESILCEDLIEECTTWREEEGGATHLQRNITTSV